MKMKINLINTKIKLKMNNNICLNITLINQIQFLLLQHLRSTKNVCLVSIKHYKL